MFVCLFVCFGQLVRFPIVPHAHPQITAPHVSKDTPPCSAIALPNRARCPTALTACLVVPIRALCVFPGIPDSIQGPPTIAFSPRHPHPHPPPRHLLRPVVAHITRAVAAQASLVVVRPLFRVCCIFNFSTPSGETCGLSCLVQDSDVDYVASHYYLRNGRLLFGVQ